VWLHLIGNAVKFSRTRDRPRVEVTGRLDGDETVYTVHDNGVGFDPRYADKLFKVFQRLHRDTDDEGQGMGRALTERIVARHGGRVWAESTPEDGAVFHFSIKG
jgi:light-regulated signal transduction histidine kinase (bacteriophytochrome)